MLPAGTKEAEIHTSTRLRKGERVTYLPIGGAPASGLIIDEPEPQPASGLTGHWVTIAANGDAPERWLMWPSAAAPYTPTIENLPVDTWPKSYDDMTYVLSKFADEIRDISGRTVSIDEFQRWMRAVVAAGSRRNVPRSYVGRA